MDVAPAVREREQPRRGHLGNGWVGARARVGARVRLGARVMLGARVRVEARVKSWGAG